MGESAMTDDERTRLRNVEAAVNAMQVEQASLKAAIAANTEVTNAVKADTAEVVQLLKGGKVFGKVVAWTAGLGAGAVAVREWLLR